MCSRSTVYTHLSGVDRYFCFSKRFSRPMSCSSVNTVRLRRPFLALLPPSSPCSSFPRRCRSSGRWWDTAPSCRPGGTDSSGGPSAEPSEQDSGDMGNLSRLVCSAFSTAGRERQHRHTRREGCVIGTGHCVVVGGIHLNLWASEAILLDQHTSGQLLEYDAFIINVRIHWHHITTLLGSKA